LAESDDGGQGPGSGPRGQEKAEETPPEAREEVLGMVAECKDGWWVVEMWGVVGGGRTFEDAVNNAVQRMPRA
jgi:hypothetical protein